VASLRTSKEFPNSMSWPEVIDWTSSSSTSPGAFRVKLFSTVVSRTSCSVTVFPERALPAVRSERERSYWRIVSFSAKTENGDRCKSSKSSRQKRSQILITTNERRPVTALATEDASLHNLVTAIVPGRSKTRVHTFRAIRPI
jgi:hypothetical protein